MATRKKSTRRTTKPRTNRRRRPRPRIKIVVAQPPEVATANAPQPAELVKVNSAVVRHRQKARAAAGAAPIKQYGSASEFVRGQPMEMPTKEVVEAGTKLGLKVTAGLVRVTRFKMRHGGEAKPAAAGRGTVRRGRPPKATAAAGKATRRGRSPAKAPAAAGALSAAEVQLRRLVVELGTARAKALVVDVERGLEALISG
jgi:hypothetical protein